MGASVGKQDYRSNLLATPSTPIDAELRPMTTANFSPMFDRRVGTIYIRGCWIGMEQIPILPSIPASQPFVVVKVTRKIEEPSNGMEEPEMASMVQAYVESPYSDSSSLKILLRKENDLVKVPLLLIGARSEEGTVTDLSMVEFEIEPLADDQNSSDYIVFVCSNVAVEAPYKLRLRNMSKLYDCKIVVPKAYNRTLWQPKDLSRDTTLKGAWSGFTSYGGAPSVIDNVDWMNYSPSYRIEASSQTRCFLILTQEQYTEDETWSIGHEKEDRLSGFGIGMVLMKLHASESRVPTDNIESVLRERIISHSDFSQEGNRVEMRAYLAPGAYQLYACTHFQRCLAKYEIFIKSDNELKTTEILPTTVREKHNSVFMNVPVPEDILSLPYKTQTFGLSTESDTFVMMVLSISDDQGDNTEPFEITGMVKCFANELEIKLWHFQLGSDPNNRQLRFNMHLKANTEYTIVPLVTAISIKRDIAFSFDIQHLESAECLITVGPGKNLFQLRSVEQLKQPTPR